MNPNPHHLSSLPSFFVPHGAPTFALRPGAAGAALRRIAASVTQPRAIIIVSAHWDTAVPNVGSAQRPETIHDFWGFPDALYELRYPATGCREAAHEVMAAITAAGLPVVEDNARGLDHGAWVPLRLMFPDADVPVIPLSIQSREGASGAHRLGEALAPLTARGFLVVGSGSLTHNLRDFQAASQNGQISISSGYVREFADWIAARLEANDLASLLNYRQQAPGGERAHPTEEHLLPFFVAMGAGGAGGAGNPAVLAQRVHAGIDDYVIAMDAYQFQSQPRH